MLDIARWSTGIIIFTGFVPLPRRGGWLQRFKVTFNHNYALSRRCCGLEQRQHSTVTMWWQDWDQCQVGTMCKMAADCSEPGRSAHAPWPGWDSGHSVDTRDTDQFHWAQVWRCEVSSGRHAARTVDTRPTHTT